jgi:regulatory protein SWI5
MLSNPPHMSGLHSRQRQHRRQNSTPSAFDAVKIAPLPSLQQRRPVAHRRGLSLDTRGQPLAPAPTTLRQEYASISIPATNAGPPMTPQRGLREAQQQRTAHPGHGQPNFTEQDSSESFVLSPQVTPSRRFAGSQGQLADLHGLSFDPYSGSLGLFDRSASRLGDTGIDPSGDVDFFGAESGLSTPSFITFPDSSPAPTCPGWISEPETGSSHSRRSSRRISNGIMDKVAKFEALGNSFDASRPCTPQNQIGNGT